MYCLLTMRTSPEVMLECVFRCLHTKCRLERHSQGRCVVLSQPVGIPPLLIPSHFTERPTLAVDNFIDIVGQNWPRNARLRTPLQRAVKQRGPLPRWPQLSQIAWTGGKHHHFPGDKEAATLMMDGLHLLMFVFTLSATEARIKESLLR